jgi:endonuclease G
VVERLCEECPALCEDSALELAQVRSHESSYFEGRDGYNPDFLGENVHLPTVTDRAIEKFGPVTTFSDGSGETELKYTHFSILMSEQRKMAYVAAVNINCESGAYVNVPRQRPGHSSDKWFMDERIDSEAQLSESFYGRESSFGVSGENHFDKGHLVRRIDPTWNTEGMDQAELANDDTFHLTNCSPQYFMLNRSARAGGDHLWGDLEDYILDNLKKDRLKASVFNGPIFETNDTPHRGTKLPKRFFKIVLVQDQQGKLHASAYIVAQVEAATDPGFEVIPTSTPIGYQGRQCTVAEVEMLTGLQFSQVMYQNDVMGRSPRRLRVSDEQIEEPIMIKEPEEEKKAVPVHPSAGHRHRIGLGLSASRPGVTSGVAGGSDVTESAISSKIGRGPKLNLFSSNSLENIQIM